MQPDLTDIPGHEAKEHLFSGPADQRQPVAGRIVSIVLAALAAFGVLVVSIEGVARWLFQNSTASTMKCLVIDDPRTGVRGVPGSFCQQKIYESSMVDYRFNDCGLRTPQPCRPAASGVIRIVLIGSSVDYGMNVDQSQSFAARLGPMLSDRLKRPVDVFNESMQWAFPASWPLRTNAMLRPRPSVILWALTPFDIENARVILPYVSSAKPGLSAPPAPRSTAASAPISLPASPSSPPDGLADLPQRVWNRLIGELSKTRTVFLLEHYLYRSQSQYLSHTLSGTSAVDYLKVPAPAELQDNLAVFAQAFAQVAAVARAAKVPLVVTLVPSRPQAIMLSNRSWNKTCDPNQLARLLRGIVEANGARYVDMTPGLESQPDAGQDFLSVDEHPTPEGHRMLAYLLANALVRSGILAAPPASPQ